MRYIINALAVCILLAGSLTQRTFAAGPDERDDTAPALVLSTTPVRPLLGEPENPIPLGARYMPPNARGKLEIQVLKTNYDAFQELLGPKYSRFTFPPAKGNKYVMARVRVTNMGDHGERAWVWRGDFGAVTGVGNSITPSGVYVHDRLWTELDGGDTVEGEIVFEVAQTENNLMLFYAPDYLRLERTHFALR